MLSVAKIVRAYEQKIREAQYTTESDTDSTPTRTSSISVNRGKMVSAANGEEQSQKNDPHHGPDSLDGIVSGVGNMNGIVSERGDEDDARQAVTGNQEGRSSSKALLPHERHPAAPVAGAKFRSTNIDRTAAAKALKSWLNRRMIPHKAVCNSNGWLAITRNRQGEPTYDRLKRDLQARLAGEEVTFTMYSDGQEYEGIICAWPPWKALKEAASDSPAATPPPSSSAIGTQYVHVTDTILQKVKQPTERLPSTTTPPGSPLPKSSSRFSYQSTPTRVSIAKSSPRSRRQTTPTGVSITESSPSLRRRIAITNARVAPVQYSKDVQSKSPVQAPSKPVPAQKDDKPPQPPKDANPDVSDHAAEKETIHPDDPRWPTANGFPGLFASILCDRRRFRGLVESEQENPFLESGESEATARPTTWAAVSCGEAEEGAASNDHVEEKSQLEAKTEIRMGLDKGKMPAGTPTENAMDIHKEEEPVQRGVDDKDPSDGVRKKVMNVDQVEGDASAVKEASEADEGKSGAADGDKAGEESSEDADDAELDVAALGRARLEQRILRRKVTS
ncbi:hypothetical protein HDV00_005563 [Rhizophlyctis rosea]|nr:hypothetical protein HDV00_005563 [Rhizophlyctis rosea]